MKRASLSICVVLLVNTAGCAGHTASGTSSSPSDAMVTDCPDLSGRYAGAGRMVRGDPTQQIGSRLTLDFVFPPADLEARKLMVSRYKVDGHGIIVPPDYVTVTKSGSNRYVIAAFYGDSEIGEYSAEEPPKTEVICKGGALYRKYQESTRSDYGPNHVTTEDMVRIDGNGDLIFRREMRVAYHALIFNLPMGTGSFFEEYRFPRIK